MRCPLKYNPAPCGTKMNSVLIQPHSPSTRIDKHLNEVVVLIKFDFASIKVTQLQVLK